MPFLVVADNCVNTIRELKGAKKARIVNKLVASRKNAPEGQRDKDDHTTDSLRYLVCIMPDLTPEDFNGTAKPKFDDIGAILGEVSDTWTGYDRRISQQRDMNGWRTASNSTEGLEG